MRAQIPRQKLPFAALDGLVNMHNFGVGRAKTKFAVPSCGGNRQIHYSAFSEIMIADVRRFVTAPYRNVCRNCVSISGKVAKKQFLCSSFKIFDKHVYAAPWHCSVRPAAKDRRKDASGAYLDGSHGT